MSRITVAIIGACIVLFGMFALTAVVLPAQPAAAQPAAGCNDTFLGFPAWYKGLTQGSDCSIKPPTKADGELSLFIWRIVLNVIEIVLRIIGVVAVFMIMYGGFQYMTSSGSPDRAAQGMKTVLNASIGLVIAISATALQSKIWSVVTAGGAGVDANTGVYTGLSTSILAQIIGIVLFVAGAVAVIVIIISGLNYVTSSGDPGKMTKAKNTLLNAIIGLVIIMAAYAIATFVAGRF